VRGDSDAEAGPHAVVEIAALDGDAASVFVDELAGDREDDAGASAVPTPLSSSSRTAVSCSQKMRIATLASGPERSSMALAMRLVAIWRSWCGARAIETRCDSPSVEEVTELSRTAVLRQADFT
jgi:hypothetical protein